MIELNNGNNLKFHCKWKRFLVGSSKHSTLANSALYTLHMYSFCPPQRSCFIVCRRWFCCLLSHTMRPPHNKYHHSLHTTYFNWTFPFLSNYDLRKESENAIKQIQYRDNQTKICISISHFCIVPYKALWFVYLLSSFWLETHNDSSKRFRSSMILTNQTIICKTDWCKALATDHWFTNTLFKLQLAMIKCKGRFSMNCKWYPRYYDKGYAKYLHWRNLYYLNSWQMC